MLKNYLLVAWRNLIKNKTFSLINIFGLAIGLSCFLMIAIYVLDELAVDRYHDKGDRIYRINSDIVFGGAELKLPVSSDAMGATLKQDYPQVQEFTRVYNSNGSKLIKKNNEFISEPRVAHVDSTFFDVFSISVIEGNLRTALNEPNTVVMTKSAAEKYFGSANAIGRIIETNDNESTLYKVTAIIRNIPENSDFNFDFLFSMDNVDYGWNNFLSHNFYTFILLKPGTDYKQFEKKAFPQYIEKYVFPQAREVMNIGSLDEFEKAGNKLQYTLIPLWDIHLRSDRSFELGTSGSIQYVYIFSAVAIFILLIACVNFMNLATARSANRAREVGIRKVLGTRKQQLVGQFLIESTVMAILGLTLAIGISYLVLPLFNQVAAKTMMMRSLLDWKLLPLLIALPLLVGLLAGSYPAFYLAGFKPINVLKGKLNLGSRGGGLRSTLVVFQFATSIVLIICTILVFRQMNYIQTKNLGFQKDQVLIINGAYALQGNTEPFKNEILRLPGVISGTYSSYLPVSNSSRSDNSFSSQPVMDAKNGFNMQNWTIDYDYISTMGMEIIKGRNFSREYGSDSSALILNETASKLLGHPDPIGKKIYTIANFNTGEIISYTIIGVVKNFHFETLRKNIGPLCFQLGRSTGLASFKISPANVENIVEQARRKWKIMAPTMPFSYRFLDESFDQMYRAEQRVSSIALIFSVLAIVVACLGLFGLATYMAEQRTKEIGIRKVLGLSVQGVVKLLSMDFMKLVLISFVIAVPVAWYFMHVWLQDFAYRIEISWWVFVMALLLAMIIAMGTISFQAIRAALANPVKSLRTE